MSWCFNIGKKTEIEKGFSNSGNQRIKEVCESLGISPISLEPYFRQSIDNGNNPYRDYIHPNLIGRQLIASAILENMPDTYETHSCQGSTEPC